MKVSHPNTSQFVYNITPPLTKMARNVSLILLTLKMTLLVNTRAQREDCFRELELELEIRSALTTLNERLDSLGTHLKKELNEAIFKMEQRTSNQDENLKRELVQIKEEIIAETERMLPYSQFTKANGKITDELQISRTLPSDCKEVQERGYNSSGAYRINPKLAKYSFLVWCDMKTENGGWTYLLNRFDGSQNFNLNWTEYKRGFGNYSGEHWLGLEHIYELTNSKSYKLLVELVDWELTTAQAFYSNFQIGKESEEYSVKNLGEYSGNGGDSLLYNPHLGIKFSTPDRDNDFNSDEESCAQYFKSGWWFTDCYRSLLTGQYINNPLPNGNYYYQSALKWNSFHGFNYSLKEARMMIRAM